MLHSAMYETTRPELQIPAWLAGVGRDWTTFPSVLYDPGYDQGKREPIGSVGAHCGSLLLGSFFHMIQELSSGTLDFSFQ